MYVVLALCFHYHLTHKKVYFKSCSKMLLANIYSKHKQGALSQTTFADLSSAHAVNVHQTSILLSTVRFLLFGKSLIFLKYDFPEEEHSSIILYPPDSWISRCQKTIYDLPTSKTPQVCWKSVNPLLSFIFTSTVEHACYQSSQSVCNIFLGKQAFSFPLQ